MRIALAVPLTTSDWRANVATLAALAATAAEHSARIVLFSEAAVTGSC